MNNDFFYSRLDELTRYAASAPQPVGFLSSKNYRGGFLVNPAVKPKVAAKGDVPVYQHAPGVYSAHHEGETIAFSDKRTPGGVPSMTSHPGGHDMVLIHEDGSVHVPSFYQDSNSDVLSEDADPDNYANVEQMRTPWFGPAHPTTAKKHPLAVAAMRTHRAATG